MRRSVLLILSMILANAISAWAMTVEEIMMQVAKAQRGVETECAEIESVLEENKNGIWAAKKNWQLTAIAQYSGQDWIRVDVQSGKEKGTKFLMKGKEQWQYLPTLNRALKISGNTRFAKFVGSDFTFEDLELEDVKKHSYKLVEELKDAWIIKALPLEKSAYVSRKLWITKENFIITQIEFVKTRGVQKILSNQKTEEIQTSVWRAGETIMLDQGNQTRTVLVFKKRKINIALPAKLFNSKSLSDDLTN